MGCNSCHTPDFMIKRANIPEEDWLVGGTLGFRGPYGTAYPTNLRLLLNNITEDEWLVLAKQMRKDSPMAWIMLSKAVDQDLRAIYAFVKHLGPKGTPVLKSFTSRSYTESPICGLPRSTLKTEVWDVKFKSSSTIPSVL